MPQATKEKMAERLVKKNEKEKAALAVMKSDAEKEEYVKKVYKPRQVMPTMFG